MFPSWWRKLVTLANGKDKTHRRGRHSKQRPRHACRPVLEQFEDRLVPTTLSLAFPSGASGARGTTVPAAVHVDDLPNGLSGGDFVVYYDSHLFSVAPNGGGTTSLDVSNGSLDQASNGWQVTANTNTPGQIIIGVQAGPNLIFGDPGAGTLATVNFHINNVGLTTVPTSSEIDLAADASLTGGSSITYVSDSNYNNYPTWPADSTAPQDNATQLVPYVYQNPNSGIPGSSTDNDDSMLTITGANQAPVASNSTYTTSDGDTLTVAGPGVFANDTNPYSSDPLTAAVISGPSHGSLNSSFNAATGAFMYTASSGYVGSDSFTYQLTDSITGQTSNIATANLTVTSRLSIPTNLVGTQGSTVVVPVNIDNADPPGSNGLTGVALAIDFNASSLSVSPSDVQLGALTSGADAVQTISFNGTAAGSTFTLALAGNSTGPITYSATQATLQANIQSAFNTLGYILNGNTQVTAVSPTQVTVTFQNADANQTLPTLTASSVGSTVSVATTTNGYPAWTLTPTNIGTTGNNIGQLGIALFSSTAITNPGGGSLLYISFHVSGSATPGTQEWIHIDATNSPIGNTVTTRVDATSEHPLPILPAPGNENVTFPNFNDTNTVPFVDGAISILPASYATHFVVSAPPAVGAGVPFRYTITALDNSNNTATGYAGTVTFTTSDGGAGVSLPVSTTLSGGTGRFTATLVTPGTQFITGTDVTFAGVTGVSGPILVDASIHFAITAPNTAMAGVPFNFTVFAEDASNNVVTGYGGTVAFSSSDRDTGINLPDPSRLWGGEGVFAAFLETSGNQVISGTDTSVSSITGVSNTITISAAAATHFVVSAPTAAIAGSAFGFTVVAEDQFNNTVTGYGGTVHFTSSDGQAGLPGGTTLVSGVGNLSATLKTAGLQTITATDASASIMGTSNQINVSPLAASHFVFVTPTSTNSGTPFVATVVAEDPYNNTATTYAGTVGLTSSDPNPNSNVVPPTQTFTNGVGLFAVNLVTAGNQTLTATDAAHPTLTGTSPPILVTAGTTTHFAVTAPTSATQGSGFSFTISAEDQYNNLTPGYTGTVHFNSSDVAVGVVLPPNTTLVGGTGMLNATLLTPGNQTISGNDTQASIGGTSNIIAVSPAATTHLKITGTPSVATAGVPFGFTVTAFNQFNTVVNNYTGLVTFTNSNSAATFVPPSNTLFNGSNTFAVTLNQSGLNTITAVDSTNSSITGTSPAILVVATTATHLVVNAPPSTSPGSPFAFTVAAEDQFNNLATSYAGTVGFSSTDTSVLTSLPSPSKLTSGAGVFIATLTTAGSQQVSATDTINPGITGSATIVVGTGTFSHFGVNGNPSTVTAGSNVNFQVKAEDQYNNVVAGYSGTVHFGITDPLAAAPGNTTLGSGVGNFILALKTAGHQTLTASDTTNPSFTGISNTITVVAASATHYVITSPSGALAGAPVVLTVTAADPYGNTATGYTGTTTFSGGGPGATLPPNTTLSGGVGTFSATLVTAGNQTITASDKTTPTISGTDGPISVTAATTPTHFAVFAPANATAGGAFLYTVSAEDASNNTVTGYSGTVHFGSSDLHAALQGNATLAGGSGVFAGTLKTAGFQLLSATDTNNNTITGSASIFVSAQSTATHLGIVGPGSATAGAGFTFTVSALDQYQNVVTTYNGTVHITSSDGGVSTQLPPGSTLTSGAGIFTATLTTSGNQTLTAADTANSSIASAAASVLVVASSVGLHFVVSAPPTTSVGSGVPFTVMAEDEYGNVNTNYLGIVKFTSTDTAAATSLPAPSSLTAGAGTFSATLTTAGNQLLSATDNTSSSITGSATISVGALAPTHFAIIAPVNATAGVAFNFTVKAEDQFNNPTSVYTGTVHFTSSDILGGLPANYTLTNGVGAFSATLDSAGPQKLTVTDTTTGSLTANTTITVVAAPVSHFVISAPSSTVAGVGVPVTVTAEDPYNNPVPGYTGAISLSGGGPGAILAPSSGLVSGVGTFSATLTTAGNQTLTATDTAHSSISGASGPIAVSAATTTVTHFVITPPIGNAATAGNPFAFLVQAEDVNNNQVLGYTGVVHFASTDATGTVPVNVNLTSGFGAFDATLRTAGGQTLTVTDANNPTITAGTAVINVSPNLATHFSVAPYGLTVSPLIPNPGVDIVGNSMGISVIALDAWNNTATGYHGTVTFTGGGSGAALPANGPLTAGVGSFSATLATAGSQTITATDTVAASLNGSSRVAVRGLIVTSLTPTTSGFVADFSKMFDPSEINLYDSSATGSVAYVTPDTVTLAGPQGLVRGSLLIDPTDSIITFVKTSNFVISTVFNPATGLLVPGNYTVTIHSASSTANGFTEPQGGPVNSNSSLFLDGTDSGSLGTNFIGTFTVGAQPAAVGVPAFARGPANAVDLPNNTGENISTTNGIPINLSSGAGVTSGTFVLAYNSNLLTITGGAVNNQQVISFSGLVTGGSFNLTFGASTAIGIQYSTNAASLQANIQNALNSLSSIIGDGGVTVQANTNTSVTVNFPNIPGSNSTQQGMTANGAGLQGAGASVNIIVTPLPVGSTLAIVTAGSGAGATATITFTSGGAALGGGAVNLGYLTATIPVTTTASYGSKTLLSFNSEQLNGGAIPVTADEAVQAIAYLGDASGDGSYSPLDASDIARVATGLDTGFAAYPRLDPVIVGSLTTSGAVTSTDAGLMDRFLGGTSVAQIPLWPGLSIVAPGPDPDLSVGAVAQATPGDSVTVPVDIDTAKPEGSDGLMEAVLALQYDPQEFTVSAADVQLGSVPDSGTGWQLTSVVNNQTGQIGIELYSTTPIQTTAGGSLVTITFHVNSTAAAGTTAVSLVPQVSPAGQWTYQTQLADQAGLLTLHQAVTPAGTEPGVPGSVTISANGPAVGEQQYVVASPTDLPAVSPPAASQADIQPAPTGALTNNSALPIGLLEQVFGNLGQTELALQESSFAQPGPLVNWESSDLTNNGARDTGLVQGFGAGLGRDWVSDDYLAYLGQTARRGLMSSTTGLLDPGMTETADDDVAGLEAYFAREVANGNRSRLP